MFMEEDSEATCPPHNRPLINILLHIYPHSALGAIYMLRFSALHAKQPKAAE